MKFKHLIFSLALILGLSFSTTVISQEITRTIDLKASSVKDQANSGTCWSFATVSFLESELQRLGVEPVDLSEIYFVRTAYPMKADRFYRLQGHTNFSAGGQAHDVMNILKLTGAVPEEAYSGLEATGNKRHDQLEMDELLKAIMHTATLEVANISKTKWKMALDSILDLYIGNYPPEFTYGAKKYNPKAFGEQLKINPDDYIEITSYTHHPFYSQFVLEVPDNWSAGLYYNVPLDELIKIMVESLSQGYTITWDGDVSGTSRFGSNKGLAVMEDEDAQVSQSDRQKAFDNFTTTDDHLMHITGMGRDDDGKIYFLTKNSWGENKGINGYWWLSENYVRMNTICIMVHKDAVPAEIAQKMGLK